MPKFVCGSRVLWEITYDDCRVSSSFDEILLVVKEGQISTVPLSNVWTGRFFRQNLCM